MIKKFVIGTLFLLYSTLNSVYGETVFIFNPEAKSSKTESVRSGLEDYLGREGIASNVYIFANPEDFRNSVGRLKPALAIIASYYYKAMESTYNWKAILSGHDKGLKSFNKVLVTSASVKNAVQLRNRSLAAVSLGAASLSYIDAQLPSELPAKDIRIVSVSKDIDAIMALGFEQVEAAIVTQTSFDKLSQINPDVVKNLHILQALNPIEYPKIAAFPNAENIEKYIKIFQEMDPREAAKEILKFFDVTGFKAD